MLKVSKTVEVITPESAAEGDSDHDLSGFEWEGREFTFRELVQEMRDYSELSCWPLTERAAREQAPWITSYPDTDPRTGHETRYSLHLDNGRDPRARRYWAKALRCAGLIKIAG